MLMGGHPMTIAAQSLLQAQPSLSRVTSIAASDSVARMTLEEPNFDRHTVA